MTSLRSSPRFFSNRSRAGLRVSMRFVWVAECFPRVMYAGWWSGDQADDTAAIDSGPADSLTAADAAILGTTPRAHDDWRNTAAIVPVCRLGPMTVQSVRFQGCPPAGCCSFVPRLFLRAVVVSPLSFSAHVKSKHSVGLGWAHAASPPARPSYDRRKRRGRCAQCSCPWMMHGMASIGTTMMHAPTYTSFQR